ncbi:MAG: ABC-F family ATP-binding cassette domain-containing protein [Terricaulis sp.]|nr:ABC-F family ATP-binding cassette domain-containing protein [Terricaulis sp.]
MAQGPVLIQANGLRLSMGMAMLFEGVDLVLHKGERAALVGANGAGKSTLMRILAGRAEADSGAIALAGGASLAYAAQEPDFEDAPTLRAYVQRASARNGVDAPPHEAEAALALFGLDPDRAPSGLSGGEARRAGLARAFAADADVLMLDEPTNHLDIEAIEELEAAIAGFRGACLIVSHDRRFLERVTNTTFWLRQRALLKNPRGYAAFDQWAEQVEVEEQRALSRLETHLRAEEHWLQRGVTARRSRNEGRRARLMAMRDERRQRNASANVQKAALAADKGNESARLVIEAKGVSKRYGERQIIDNFSLRVMRGDRIGLVGPNGAGKTTMLEILLRQREPDAGAVRHGAQLEIAYVDQTRAILNPSDTIWEALAPMGGDQVIVHGRPRHVAAYARNFLFGPESLRQPISALSGGERNRLALAIALAKPANLLVLDEPTNDLDMDTLDQLEDMLAGYDGTVLIVSHDRAFLDGVATQIVGPIGGGRWVESPGGWADFERAFPRKPAAAPAPKAAAPIAPAAPRKATKLSYKDERRAAELDALMPKLQAEIAALEARLAQDGAFERDPAAFQKIAAQLEAARATLEAAEAEWLDIELKRESLAAET